MKKMLRKMELLLDSSFFELRNFLKWLIHFKYASLKEKNSNIGEKLVLVCNGPSAKEFPFEAYKNHEYTFCCVNDFALSEELFRHIKPKFYCLVDTAYGAPGYKDTEVGRELTRIFENVDWEMNIICYKGRHLVLENKNIHYRYVNSNPWSGELNRLKYFLYKNNLASTGFQNVSIAALFYFIMSGVDSVVLTGVENDWHRELVVEANNDVCREYVHFYGVEKINVTEAGQIGRGELYKYFEWYVYTLKQHSMIAKFAEKANVKIENSCMHSFIDAYLKSPPLTENET